MHYIILRLALPRLLCPKHSSALSTFILGQTCIMMVFLHFSASIWQPFRVLVKVSWTVDSAPLAWCVRTLVDVPSDVVNKTLWNIVSERTLIEQIYLDLHWLIDVHLLYSICFTKAPSFVSSKMETRLVQRRAKVL